jgi:hypothetical protein
MALFAYQQQTQELLSDLKQEIVNPAFLVKFINTARGQIAGEAECIRVIANVVTSIGVRNYNFSAFVVSGSAGVASVLHIRRLMYTVASGQKWIAPRAWEYFDYYFLNNPVPQSSFPTEWSQYAQGSLGSIYLDPLPDLAYTLSADCVCVPVNLVTDATAEAIPYPWTDAIPYFAAYLAYLSVQRPDRSRAMMELYETFMERARRFANPSVNRGIYQQAQDPTRINQLGLQKERAAQ